MANSILKILNVEKGEEKPVMLLLGMGFSLGVFLAAYQSTAEVLFLNNIGEAYLKEAFLVSGVLGVLSTWLYASIQTRIKFSWLVISNAILIFIFIAVIRVLFSVTDSKWVVFILYVFHAPILSVNLLGFWGVFGRIFDIRQSKRIIGGIDSGQLLAAIVTFSTMPFILKMLPSLPDLLVIGEVGLVLNLIFLILILSNYDLNSFYKLDKKRFEDTKLKNIFKDKYVIYLAVFLFFSMMAFTLVNYSFLSVAGQQYPDETKLFNFISFLNASYLILSLLVQTFVNEKLISMYGLRTTLIVLPIILAIFSLLAIIAGYYSGFDVTNTSFIWFFLFITISKLFTTTLREATENPVFKLFFMPLDSRVRFDIQTRVEGMANELSRLIAGLVIFGLGVLAFVHLIHYTFILMLVIVGWVYMAIKIYSNYRENIRNKLESQKNAMNRKEQKGKELLLAILRKAVRAKNPEEILFSLRLMAKISPKEFITNALRIKSSPTATDGKLALRLLEEDHAFVPIRSFLADEELDDKSGRQKEWVEEMKEKLMDRLKNLTMMELRSLKAEDKISISEFVSRFHVVNDIKILTELLNDNNPNVVKSAIISVGVLKKVELLPLLVDSLREKNYKDTAIDAILSFGEVAFQHLDTVFYNSEHEEELKQAIIQIYGRVGGEQAKTLLWNKIDFPDYTIVSQVLVGLSQCGFKAESEQISRIKFVIEGDIGNILWNLLAIQKLKDEDRTKLALIISALEEEIQHNYNHIYMLLSMIFDRKTIQLVKENIDSKTNEGVSYALELLDVFLPEDLKQKIIPILDDVSDTERIRKLLIFYPQLELNQAQIIKAIISRNYNETNRWTKATALHYIGQQGVDHTYQLELIANLFNPDMLLCEVSAWSLNKLNTEYSEEHIPRLDPQRQEHLKRKIRAEGNKSSAINLLRFDIIRFLKLESDLKELSGLFLSYMVDNLEAVYLPQGEMLEMNGQTSEYFYLVYRGVVHLKSNAEDNGDILFSKGQYMGELIGQRYNIEKITLEAVKETTLLRINKNHFYELVSEDYEITLKMILAIEQGTNSRKKETIYHV